MKEKMKEMKDAAALYLVGKKELYGFKFACWSLICFKDSIGSHGASSTLGIH